MSAATRAGYEPDKLLTGLADIITGRTDAVETRQILWAAARFIEAEGRAVELASLGVCDPQQWYNQVESERRALNDGESGPYNTSR